MAILSLIASPIAIFSVISTSKQLRGECEVAEEGNRYVSEVNVEGEEGRTTKKIGILKDCEHENKKRRESR